METNRFELPPKDGLLRDENGKLYFAEDVPEAEPIQPQEPEYTEEQIDITTNARQTKQPEDSAAIEGEVLADDDPRGPETNTAAKANRKKIGFRVLAVGGLVFAGAAAAQSYSFVASIDNQYPLYNPTERQVTNNPIEILDEYIKSEEMKKDLDNRNQKDN